jgi:hypothetical protein
MRIQSTGYVAGTHLACCDRCGFNFRSNQIKLEWTGLRVCRDCWEPRNEQDFVQGIADRQAPPWVRPEPDPVDVGVITPEDL